MISESLTRDGVPDAPASVCGIAQDEGLIVAYIPDTGAMPQEYPYRDGDRWFTAVAYDGRLLDLMPHDRKGVRWWQVREAAREHRLEQISPIWTGQAGEFRVSCLPQLPRPSPAHRLAMRQFTRGPWILLEAKNEPQLEFDFHSRLHATGDTT